MEAPSRGARKLIEAFDGRWNFVSLFLAKFVPVPSFVPKLNNNEFIRLDPGVPQ